MSDDTRREIYNAMPCGRRSIMWCHVKRNLRCDVIKKKIDDVMPRRSIMKCHAKGDLKRNLRCNVTRKKIYYGMPCGENLKKNLRCNATQKKIYYEMSCEKDLKRNLWCNATRKKIYHEMSYEKRSKKKSMMQCHAEKDLSCVPCEKNKKTMSLRSFFNSVWNFVIFRINFSRVMFRVFSIGISNWKDFLLNALWSKLHMYVTLKQWTKNANIFLKIFNSFNWNHFQWYHSCFLHFSHFSLWTLTTWCPWSCLTHQFWFEQSVPVLSASIIWIQM